MRHRPRRRSSILSLPGPVRKGKGGESGGHKGRVTGRIHPWGVRTFVFTAFFPLTKPPPPRCQCWFLRTKDLLVKLVTRRVTGAGPLCRRDLPPRPVVTPLPRHEKTPCEYKVRCPEGPWGPGPGWDRGDFLPPSLLLPTVRKDETFFIGSPSRDGRRLGETPFLSNTGHQQNGLDLEGKMGEDGRGRSLLLCLRQPGLGDQGSGVGHGLHGSDLGWHDGEMRDPGSPVNRPLVSRRPGLGSDSPTPLSSVPLVVDTDVSAADSTRSGTSSTPWFGKRDPSSHVSTPRTDHSHRRSRLRPDSGPTSWDDD